MIDAGDVTVVLCTRDGLSKGYFDAAVRSVLDQSLAPGEVIVVDDASTDGTPQYARRTYPHLRVVANARSGLAACRNTGIGAARGRWIAFIDDDDVWHPGKLAAQLAQIGGSDLPESTIWAARMVRIDSAGRVASRPVFDQLARWPACLLGSPALPSGVIMARALLDRFGAFAEHLRVGSAYEYWIRCLAGGATIRFSDAVLLEHRQHDHQMTAPQRLLELQLAVDAMVAPYLERLPAAQADRVRTARLLMHCLLLLFRSGPRTAARYWRRTPLRRGGIAWRVSLYPLLAAAARPLPLGAGIRVRDFVTRAVTGPAPDLGKVER